MDVRILDLDSSVAEQPRLMARASSLIPLCSWGPKIRLACSWGAFARFQHELLSRIDDGQTITFVGSGDFHHVSLALLQHRTRPFNLLVIDNHPDWMRGVPLLHCGTWLRHAAELPQVRRVFHAGGDVDFDNRYRWLAPWPLLRSEKITVFPAVRRFRGAAWQSVPHTPLRSARNLLAPWKQALQSLPLYISLDRDVLRSAEAVVNWDSGHLTVEEVLTLIREFIAASAGLAGMDVVGDWSPVKVNGPLRHFLHTVEHPRAVVDQEEAQQINEQLNLALVELLTASHPTPAFQAIT